MNVFVLNSGRCGSTTFIQACRYIDNFSAAHESRIQLLGPQRLAYPEQHIEADNRLAWFLGRLERAYGTGAFYVHLQRDPAATAASFAKRSEFGIMQAYREGILLGAQSDQTSQALAEDYLDTIEANIALFLRDKPQQMVFRLENAKADFTEFWDRIGASGELSAALEEWQVQYNAS
ncbi:hypothetical protein [Candidatus Endoriftia persephone]|uniref:Sulphotransferase Stf0 domain-containing protein n=3 Tax=Gammaproteobacteria TaxID=1236 RepID=G2FDN2_9GAMM|nr:hypothetical protein [Candidatus Endoriftia persephone]EGV51472.1 hypothetical protein Rifp1Sym_bi00140 [endosymbiont of Riftia pachyptila (vent Ph05)]EGW55087.1 hypothetical protein TevJSym_af00520 [endosymbiont of Tevnia jerichonana (vent Tica)]USF88306.1 hypothetical protein L0Y14_03440 [Candidatus Endoriftia persephone]